MSEKKGFPGVLWILPVFFGLLGGVIAAMIASMRYGASWWELLLVGLLVQVGVVVLWLVLQALLLASII